MSGQLNTEIEDCVRKNVTWQYLPVHLKQVQYKKKTTTMVAKVERCGWHTKTIKLRHIHGTQRDSN